MKTVLSVKQVAFIASIMILCSKLLILPSLLFKENRYGGLFVLIFMLAVELGLLYLFIKIKEKNHNISFGEYMSSFIGKIATKVVYLILFTFFFMKLIYISHESFNFIKLTLYETTDLTMYWVCLLPVVVSLAYKGLKTLGRTLEIFYYAIIFVVVLCSVIWISSLSDLAFVLFDNNGFGGFVSAIYKYSFWFGDFAFLFIIFDKVKLEDNYGRVLMNYSLFTMIVVAFIFLSYYEIYQSSSFFHTAAILDIIQFSTRLGSVSKLDFLAVFVVAFLLFFQFGMYLYCSKQAYKEVLNSKSNARALIVIVLAYIILNYFVFYSLDSVIEFFETYFTIPALLVSIGIPIILFVKFLFFKESQKTARKVLSKPIIKRFY